MGFWGSLWMLLVVGCLAALVVVVSTINEVRDDVGEAHVEQVGTVWPWVIGTVLGAVVWLFFILLFLGFGFNHNSGMGVGGVFANILSFGGPALYIFSSYRRMESAKALRQSLLSAEDTASA